MSIDDQLDAIYYDFDTKFRAGDFAEVDTVLAAADPVALGNELAIGTLCAAFPARARLSCYEAFKERCRVYYGSHAKQMLQGL